MIDPVQADCPVLVNMLDEPAGSDAVVDAVVLEVIENDPAALQSLIPFITQWVRAARAARPELSLMLVSHGNESLTLAHEPDSVLSRQLETLGDNQALSVSVCGTYAGWRGLSPADFPDYLQVLDSADSALTRQRAAGALIVRLRPASAAKPDDMGFPEY